MAWRCTTSSSTATLCWNIAIVSRSTLQVSNDTHSLGQSKNRTRYIPRILLQLCHLFSQCNYILRMKSAPHSGKGVASPTYLPVRASIPSPGIDPRPTRGPCNWLEVSPHSSASPRPPCNYTADNARKKYISACANTAEWYG